MNQTATIAPDRNVPSPADRNVRAHQEEPAEVTELSGKEDDGNSWRRRGEEASAALSESTLNTVAGELGVSPAALRSLGMGFEGFAVTFPMHDAGGRVVGLRLRPLKDLHAKQGAEGSALGLFLPGERQRGKAELICEGESDTAAGLTLGFASIGTPGAGQCAGEAARFCRARLTSAPCIVAHNDPDKTGQRGAERIAAALLAASVPCRVLTVPSPWKDLRDWLMRGGLTSKVLRKVLRECTPRLPERFPRGFLRLPHHLARRGALRQVGPTAWAVWCAIAGFADAEGRCWPARRLLAELVGVDVRTIDGAKARLRAAGLLTWKRGGIAGGKKRANVYTIDAGEIF